MKKDLISVIIPVYNREKYIRDCIDSVLAQDNCNFEIIAVDDGSSDNSPAILDEYAQRYEEIKVIHKKNQGVSAARNSGLDICSGEYIFFIDSDDQIEKNALSKLLTKLRENNADICIGNYNRYYEDGTLEYENYIPENLRDRIINEEELFSLMNVDNSYLWSASIGNLYKRKIFNTLRFPTDLTAGEDEYIVPRVLDNAEKIYLVSEALYHQIYSSNSITRNKISVKRLDSTYAILKITDYLIKKKYYKLALSRFGKGTRLLMQWRKMNHDKEFKEAVSRQYRDYCKEAKKLMPYFNKSVKFRLSLFCINIDLYEFVRLSLKKLKFYG